MADDDLAAAALAFTSNRDQEAKDRDARQARWRLECEIDQLAESVAYFDGRRDQVRFKQWAKAFENLIDKAREWGHLDEFSAEIARTREEAQSPGREPWLFASTIVANAIAGDDQSLIENLKAAGKAGLLIPGVWYVRECIENLCKQITKPPKPRPDPAIFECSGHYFSHLRVTRDITDAKIRDHWDSLPQEQRKSLCPNDYGRLADSTDKKRPDGRPDLVAMADIVKRRRTTWEQGRVASQSRHSSPRP